MFDQPLSQRFKARSGPGGIFCSPSDSDFNGDLIESTEYHPGIHNGNSFFMDYDRIQVDLINLRIVNGDP
jgi:hypothetical protein